MAENLIICIGLQEILFWTLMALCFLDIDGIDFFWTLMAFQKCQHLHYDESIRHCQIMNATTSSASYKQITLPHLAQHYFIFHLGMVSVSCAVHETM